MKRTEFWRVMMLALACSITGFAADDPPTSNYGAAGFPKPYSPPCTEREDVFAFTEKPAVKALGNDKYEITFAVKGNCDAAVGIVDSDNKVVRHLGAGVLGANAPVPFQKNSLKQTIYWNGKDDLDVYHKSPEKLKVRVQLGLKPEFDKRLGGTSPKNMPGVAWGLVAHEEGVVLISVTGRNGGIFYLRRFDHDGNYVGTILPPPANLPADKLTGAGFVEYERARKAAHACDLDTVLGAGNWLPIRPGGAMPWNGAPVVFGGRLYYTSNKVNGTAMEELCLHYIGLDGSMDAAGVAGQLYAPKEMCRIGGSRMAISPDGKWMYAGTFLFGSENILLRIPLDGKSSGEVFIGEFNKPGSDNQHFNGLMDVDCDALGKIYICDRFNNRVQVFSADGKHFKTIPIANPLQVRVHRKTGAIYVQHMASDLGVSKRRISKLASLENTSVVAKMDCQPGLMALDSWTAKPRVWLFGTGPDDMLSFDDCRLTIWEEDGATFRKISDFEEEVLKEDGANYAGPWSGNDMGGSGGGGKIACDPVREQVYYRNERVFDLRTGKLAGCVRLPGSVDDLSFDKKGYLHAHWNAGFSGMGPGVARHAPGQRKATARAWGSRMPEKTEFFSYPEVPYDYGVDPRQNGSAFLGILPVRDQPGAKYFQDGMGVNMRGDVAEECNIFYAPKFEEETSALVSSGLRSDGYHGAAGDQEMDRAAASSKEIQMMIKRGEEVYSIRPQPGLSLMGGTIWVFESNGELRSECAVSAGRLINGTMIDEDGDLYFVVDCPRIIGGKPFLTDRGSVPGKDGKTRKTRTPFTGTLIKTHGAKAQLLLKHASIKLDFLPDRAPELSADEGDAWMEGAAWFYAGASPIVHGACSCPTQRLHLDWFKRVYVPEAYRHSIAVLDTNGNLILHIGQYGNIDSGEGSKSRIPLGGDGISMTMVRMISGTDNYLCFPDNGERLTVLKLNYHAEESAGIQ